LQIPGIYTIFTYEILNNKKTYFAIFEMALTTNIMALKKIKRLTLVILLLMPVITVKAQSTGNIQVTKSDGTSGINKVAHQTRHSNGKSYKLNGQPANERDKGVIITNGKKIIK
jgi:hypothetical protein